MRQIKTSALQALGRPNGKLSVKEVQEVNVVPLERPSVIVFQLIWKYKLSKLFRRVIRRKDG